MECQPASRAFLIAHSGMRLTTLSCLARLMRLVSSINGGAKSVDTFAALLRAAALVTFLSGAFFCCPRSCAILGVIRCGSLRAGTKHSSKMKHFN